MIRRPGAGAASPLLLYFSTKPLSEACASDRGFFYVCSVSWSGISIYQLDWVYRTATGRSRSSSVRSRV